MKSSTNKSKLSKAGLAIAMGGVMACVQIAAQANAQNAAQPGTATAKNTGKSAPQMASPAQTAAPAKAPAAAQAIPAVTAPQYTHSYSAKDIARRPYSPAIPAPLYPSTPRKQSQFTVQYVYNFAQSTYSPSVTLPLVSRASVRRDTPEAALTAFYSAMRSGDYEAWLQCWDEPSRRDLEAQTKEKKNGAEYWRALWRQFYAGKQFVLLDRLETVNYIILDAAIDDPTKPNGRQMDSQTLVGHEGQWWVTNAFTNDGLVMNFDPSAPTTEAVKEYDLAPAKDLAGPAALTGQAQKDFYAHHTSTASLTRTVE